MLRIKERRDYKRTDILFKGFNIKLKIRFINNLLSYLGYNRRDIFRN